MNLRKIALATAISVVLFTIGLTSCFAYSNYFDWEPCIPCMEDTSGGEGCSGCNGGSGSIDSILVSLTNGTAITPFNIPFLPISTNQRKTLPAQEHASGLSIIDELNATLSLPGGAYNFSPTDPNDISKPWKSNDPGLTLQPTNVQDQGLIGMVIIEGTITYKNMSKMYFSHLNQPASTNLYSLSSMQVNSASAESTATYHLPDKIVDAQGRETTYTLDWDDTNNIPDGMPTSILLPDGRTYSYGYNSNGELASVTYPDGKTHMLIEGGLWPTKVSIVDTDSQPPADPAETTYEYDGSFIMSVTGSNHIKTKVEYYYDYPKVEYVRVMDDPDYVVNNPSKYPTGYTPQVYSHTRYTYGTATEGGVTYGRTKVRNYADPGTVTYDSVGHWTPEGMVYESIWQDHYDLGGDDSKDRVEEHWYYRVNNENSFLYKVVEMFYENSQLVPLHTIKYNRDMTTPNSWNYGNITSVVEIDYEGDTHSPSRTRERTLSTYDYYDPDTLYDVTSSPDVAPYPVVSTEGIAGNGETRQATYLGGNTISCNYYVDQVNGVMRPFTTIVSDDNGTSGNAGDDKSVKCVVSSTGNLLEVYQQVGQNHQLEMIKSYTYYSTPDTPQLGMPNTKTVYEVATQGASSPERAMVMTYSYNYDNGWTSQDPDWLTITAACNGKSAKVCSDVLGQLLWGEDDQGRQTKYDYDWKGRSTATTYPIISGENTPSTTVNEYDCCHLSAVKDENDHRTYFGYDPRGRVTKMWADIEGQSTDSPLLEYDYTVPYGTGTKQSPFGRLEKVKTRKSSSTEATISFSYDNLQRVNMVSYADPNSLGFEEYQYDDYGRLAATKDGANKITAYEYDDLDRVVKVDYNYQGTFNQPITLPTLVNLTTDPDGSIVTYTYDGSSNRIAAVAEIIDGQNVTSSYQYDDLGRLESYTPALPADYGSITYTWNTLNQKTSMTVPMGNGSAKKYIYHYDNEGRQIGTDVETVAVTSSPTLSSNVGTGSDMRFFYDDYKNRVKLITKDGDVYYFVYDPTAAIPSVVYEAVSKTMEETTTVTAYLNNREPAGFLISREKYVDGVLQYSRTYHFDGLGSTIALTDENGVTTDTYSYDAWGNVTHTSGTIDDNPYQYVGEYGYYTHYQEPSFNLLQLGVRYYDPSTGRFTQEDPIKDGLSWYAYCDNNPMDAVDPSGLEPESLSKRQREVLSEALQHLEALRPKAYEGIVDFRAEYNIKYDPEEIANGYCGPTIGNWEMGLGANWSDLALTISPAQSAANNPQNTELFLSLSVAATIRHEYNHYAQGFPTLITTDADRRCYQVSLDFLADAYKSYSKSARDQRITAEAYRAYVSTALAWAREAGIKRSDLIFKFDDSILKHAGTSIKDMIDEAYR